MSAALLVIPTLCYLGVAANELRHGNYPQALVWAGYTLGNLGFIWGFAK